MEIINSYEIKREELIRLDDKKNVYYKGEIAYKYFKPDEFDKPDNTDYYVTSKVLEALSKAQLNNVAIPYQMIMNEFQLLGITMKYYKDYNMLGLFREQYGDYNIYINIIKAVTETLKEIHNNGFIVTDLHFGNILFNSNFDHVFVDTNDWSTERYHNAATPILLLKFLERKKIFFFFPKPTVYLDKLLFILSFFHVIFGKPIERMPRRDVENTLDKMELSRETIVLIRKILDDNPFKLDLPYIGDNVKHSKEQCFYLKK